MFLLIYKNMHYGFMLCMALFCIGCYTPLMHLQSIGLAEDMPSYKLHADNIDKISQNTIIFYKECSHNGSAWLYECQSIGLESLQQAIYLYYPNTIINNITMFFYPKKTYIRFEIHDSSLLQDIP